jgi:hypothetical protein
MSFYVLDAYEFLSGDRFLDRLENVMARLLSAESHSTRLLVSPEVYYPKHRDATIDK